MSENAKGPEPDEKLRRRGLLAVWREEGEKHVAEVWPRVDSNIRDVAVQIYVNARIAGYREAEGSAAEEPKHDHEWMVGLTSKQAWWAGARAGLGMDPAAPRAEVAASLAAARHKGAQPVAIPAPEPRQTLKALIEALPRIGEGDFAHDVRHERGRFLLRTDVLAVADAHPDNYELGWQHGVRFADENLTGKDIVPAPEPLTADLLKRLHGIADGIRLYGTPDHELAADRIDAIGAALAQPADTLPAALARYLEATADPEGRNPAVDLAVRLKRALAQPAIPAPEPLTALRKSVQALRCWANAGDTVNRKDVLELIDFALAQPAPPEGQGDQTEHASAAEWLFGAEANPTRCPKCNSPSPRLHPAVQHEGEVEICTDPWHGSKRAAEVQQVALQVQGALTDEQIDRIADNYWFLEWNSMLARNFARAIELALAAGASAPPDTDAKESTR